MTDWQPIKSAPREQWLLVVDERSGEYAVWKTYRITATSNVCAQDVSGISGYECEVDILPTHWQPLPEMPGPKR